MDQPLQNVSQARKPRGFELRIGLLFAAAFVPMGVQLPFFPLWLEHGGFSAEEIAVILAAPMFLRVITTPAITALADRVGERAYVLIAVAATALVVSLFYFLPPSYPLVLAVSLGFAVFWAPHVPLADALALSGVRRFGSDYALMRIWGSIAFLLVNLAGGWAIAEAGAGIVPAMLTSGLAATFLVALSAPRLGRPRRASPLSAAELPQAAGLFGRYFLLMMAGYGLTTSSHGFLYAFVSIYWKELGLSGTLVGGLWAFSVVAEVALFLVFSRVLGRWRASSVLMLSAGLATLRWAIFPVIWPLGLGLPGFFIVQGLHAFSFGAALLGMQKMVAETVPEERTGAAQGVAFFASGFGMAAVTLASGPLYDAVGAGGFHAMAATTAAAFVLIVLARRSAPERRLGR